MGKGKTSGGTSGAGSSKSGGIKAQGKPKDVQAEAVAQRGVAKSHGMFDGESDNITKSDLISFRTNHKRNVDSFLAARYQIDEAEAAERFRKSGHFSDAHIKDLVQQAAKREAAKRAAMKPLVEKWSKDNPHSKYNKALCCCFGKKADEEAGEVPCPLERMLTKGSFTADFAMFSLANGVFTVKPQMKFGAGYTGTSLAWGFSDVRDGLELVVEAKASASIEGKGSTLKEFVESIMKQPKCEDDKIFQKGMNHILQRVGEIMGSIKEADQKVREQVGQEVADKTWGQDGDDKDTTPITDKSTLDAPHSVSGKAEASVAVGAGAKVCYPFWKDTKGFRMYGMGGGVSVAAEAGFDFFFGWNPTTGQSKAIIAVSNVSMEVVFTPEDKAAQAKIDADAAAKAKLDNALNPNTYHRVKDNDWEFMDGRWYVQMYADGSESFEDAIIHIKRKRWEQEYEEEVREESDWTIITHGDGRVEKIETPGKLIEIKKKKRVGFSMLKYVEDANGQLTNERPFTMYSREDQGQCVPYYIHRQERNSDGAADELQWFGRGQTWSYLHESVASVAGNVIVWDSVACGKQVWFKTGKRYQQFNAVLSCRGKTVDQHGFTAKGLPEKCYSYWAKNDATKEVPSLEGPGGAPIKKDDNVMTQHKGEWREGQVQALWEDHTVSISFEDSGTDIQLTPDPVLKKKAQLTRAGTEKLGTKPIKPKDKVITRYAGQWCNGTVKDCYADDTLTIEYEDGDKWRGVPTYVFFPEEKQELEGMKKDMKLKDWCKMVGVTLEIQRVAAAYVQFTPDPVMEKKEEVTRVHEKLGSMSIKPKDKVITRNLGQWWNGTVKDCFADDTVTIEYDDGDKWRGAAKFIFSPDEKQKLEGMKKDMKLEEWCKMLGVPVVQDD